VDELADQKRKLDLLDAGGDCRSSVRDVFSWSYQHLDTAVAQAFRLLALPPGPEYDQYAVAALTGTTKEAASRALTVLARAHLIYVTAPGRYGMHDLLRAYADELTTAVDGEDERRSALTRLFDHYLYTAAAAMDSLFPAETRRPQVPVPASPAPCVTDPAAAGAWLDAQRANLVAVCVHAAASGWPGHATDLSATLARYLDNGGHFPEAVTIHTHARDIARRTGDRAAEAAALSSLGLTAWWQGRYQQAADHLQDALALHRGTGDLSSEAYSLANLAIVAGQQGRYQQAADHLQDALALHRQVGDAIGEARALSNLGMVDDQQGRYESAASFYRRSLALSRQAGDHNSEAYALVNLGVIERRLDHPGTAARYIQQGLSLFRQGGNRSAQSSALAALGDVELQQGDPGQAADHYQRSIALCRELGALAGETTALNGLGEAFRMAGRPGDARAQHAAALTLAAQIGHKHEQARAHDGLASSYAASGDIDRSRSHWREALTLYVGLGAPEADQVRTRLAHAAAPLTHARE
jgi:tetratricopeptide (TPR) repeat protein